MAARTCHRQKAQDTYGVRKQTIDIDETEIGQVRLKLHRLMAKRMAGDGEFKSNVENMRRTLSGIGGESKLRQEVLRKTMEHRMSKLTVENGELKS